ncbi:MAG TPA: DUF4440 domain-containing protein [Caulobacteraceae bacterium]|jgi:uncharacterized protein (TIGR02246 family)
MTPLETKRALIQRMNAKDLAGTMELIADDAVYFWSNGSAMFGKAAIEEAMAANFVGIEDDTYDTHDLTWVAENDEIAACVFSFAWTGKMDGQPVSGRGRGATVLKRIDGAWRVVHEHLSQGRWKPR